ncbi:MAG: hypothetical protein PHG29_10645 [Prolixibacteraceae bacterium]|jgi:hypothetical protein|nr:hypothetical protein [Prolixibacteraceae bacterium]NLO01697.1 exo-alpha-sialidase [Bacteroidales bacterium]
MENYYELKNSPLENKYGRRKFLKTSIVGSISVLCMPPISNVFYSSADRIKFDLSLDSPTRYFDGDNCFVHARSGIVPGAGENGLPRIVMTMNTQDLSGSDVFRGVYGMHTDDLGKHWTTPSEVKNLAPHYEIINGERRPAALSDFSPKWHKSSKALLGTGHTVVYTQDWKVRNPRPRNTSYSVYSPDSGIWSAWQKLEMPDPEKFYDCGSGSVQRYDLRDGTILLPVSFRPPGSGIISTVTVIRCAFYRKKLVYIEHGNEMNINVPRGFGEPSLTFFSGKYFLTLRNDQQGYVTKGSDGLHFDEPRVWTFDDGEELGNYNTQQHWVTHSDGLFLVYTRRGAGNDHVFRHRAPLFMAQADPDKLCVIRDTERILVPERGARLGNFGVTDINADETWVTVSEWMQPRGVEKYGSDGTVFVARIHWATPNRIFQI